MVVVLPSGSRAVVTCWGDGPSGVFPTEEPSQYSVFLSLAGYQGD